MLTMLNNLRVALETFDILEIEAVVNKMSSYNFSDEERYRFSKLKKSVEDSDIDECSDIVEEWIKSTVKP